MQVKNGNITKYLILKERVTIPPMPPEVSILAENIDDYKDITESICKQPRTSTQTSYRVNNEQEPS